MIVVFFANAYEVYRVNKALLLLLLLLEVSETAFKNLRHFTKSEYVLTPEESGFYRKCDVILSITFYQIFYLRTLHALQARPLQLPFSPPPPPSKKKLVSQRCTKRFCLTNLIKDSAMIEGKQRRRENTIN